MIHSLPQRHATKSAFTLIELLVVIAIIGVLVAIAIPSIRGLSKGQSITNSVTLINGVLNNARQEAITKNTYVYVAMASLDKNGHAATSASQDPTLWIATFSSNDGTGNSVDLGSTPSIDLTNTSNLQLSGTPRSFEHLLLTDKNVLKPSSLPNPDVDLTNINSLNDGTTKVPASGSSITLNRLMVFTPSGQAMSDTELNQYIEFGIVGSQDSTPPKDPAVFRISGNLGVVTVYRN